MKYIVFFFIIIKSIHASCINDIYSVGMSGDSFIYKVKKSKNEDVDVASDLGIGAKLSKIIFCPKQNMEYTLFYRLRYFNLKSLKDDPDFSKVDDKVFLNSLGLDGRYLKSKNVEYSYGFYLREEFAPFNLSDTQFEFGNEKYFNILTPIGIRYFVHSNRKEDYSIHAQISPLIPLTDEAQWGYMGELNLEYFKRINKKYSIRADLYLSAYDQKYDDYKIVRTEIGARYNYVFRY